MKTQLQELLDELNIKKSEFLKMQDLVDDTYYNLCRLWLYDSIYYKLQNIHWLLDDLVDWNYIEEDDFSDIICFYENNYKTI